MSARAGHDLSGIIKWCAREDWLPRVDAVMAEHFEPAMKAFGLDFQEIGEIASVPATTRPVAFIRCKKKSGRPQTAAPAGPEHRLSLRE